MPAPLDEEIPNPLPEKPTSLKVLYGIIIGRISLMILSVFLVKMAAMVDPSDYSALAEFLRGARNAVRVLNGYAAFQVKFIIGQFFLPFVLSAVLLLLLERRNFTGSMITMTIILFLSIIGLSSFILALTCMILLLSKKTKEYLKHSRV